MIFEFYDSQNVTTFSSLSNGSFTFPETDSDSDSDSKLNGYIVLYRICSHCTDSDFDSPRYFCVELEFESKSVPQSLSITHKMYDYLYIE